MKGWYIAPDFIIDEDPPEWATQLVWRHVEHFPNRILIRAWVNEHDTQYQYLRGFSGVEDTEPKRGSFINGSFRNAAWYIGHRKPEEVKPAPMVCHDEFGFSTDEFKAYSQSAWDTTRDQAQAIIAKAISDGVSPVAMKELLTTAIDCGTTLAMCEARVNSHK